MIQKLLTRSDMVYEVDKQKTTQVENDGKGRCNGKEKMFGR